MLSPLAIQGPRADDLAATGCFGEAVRSIRFFRYKRLAFNGVELVVGAVGLFQAGGFEIYVEGGQHGEPLWDALFEAGRDLDVRAGCPNLIERIEAGMLSYGNDMTRRAITPHELRYWAGSATARSAIGCVGRDAPSQGCQGRSAQADPLSGDPMARQCRHARTPGPSAQQCAPVGQVHIGGLVA